MEKPLKLEVLDSERMKVLPLLRGFKDDFYLAGGTGLALQIGHRESVDFDFFASQNFDLSNLHERVRNVFIDYSITIVQFEKNTYSIILNDAMKLSFFKINDAIILPLIQSEWFQLCSILEIGAMKIAALFRGAYRDYVDIYFILMQYRLESILETCNKKYNEFDQALYLKALLSYDDLEETPIKYLSGMEKRPEDIFSFIEKEVKLFLAKAI